MLHSDLVDAGRRTGQVQGLRDVGRLHGGAQGPGHDVARVVIEDRRQGSTSPSSRPADT